MLKEDRTLISAPVNCQDWRCCFLNSDWWIFIQERNPVIDYFRHPWRGASINKCVGIFAGMQLKYDFNVFICCD